VEWKRALSGLEETGTERIETWMTSSKLLRRGFPARKSMKMEKRQAKAVGGNSRSSHRSRRIRRAGLPSEKEIE
jgi:hypothetical protein